MRRSSAAGYRLTGQPSFDRCGVTNTVHIVHNVTSSRNSLPPTTTLGNYMAKLTAARDKLYVDVSFWGGIIPGNTRQLRNMIKYGVVGFKCFLCPSGVPEFPQVDHQQLEWALTEIRDLDVTIAV